MDLVLDHLLVLARISFQFCRFEVFQFSFRSRIEKWEFFSEKKNSLLIRKQFSFGQI